MKRDKNVQAVVDDIAKKAFGISQSEAEEKAVCVFCKESIDPEKDFRNETSRKEFTISGICQGCQDGIFGKD